MIIKYIVLILAIFNFANVYSLPNNRGKGKQDSPFDTIRMINSSTFSEPDSLELTERIINGKPANITQFPFIAQIFYRNASFINFSFRCTGSLISDLWILTAAHCLTDVNRNLVSPGDFRVAVGKDELVANADANDQYRVSFIGNFGYKENATLDAGLIKLAKPVPSIVATPAKLYTSPVKKRLRVNIAGFGLTDYAKPTPSNVLLQTRVYISQSANCSGFSPGWKSNNGPQICQENYKDLSPCKGDSGGPMVTKIKGKNVIVGITSSGGNKDKNVDNPCGHNVIDYYARVGYYVNSISKTTGIPLKNFTAT
ncbi:hypothetical protein BB560_000335 [Smittium megazygosporum]|uniref:Peptidase S1 domain-containing protein n=1 Tax=Smittium megazygosporum TaxID=133381 RepID=A0A2T9ZKN5_9FUNG|nr:hypothetical protein BB560_000335 [Smittium megazygosporum]